MYGGPAPVAAGALQFTRRIKLDLATSTVRFVESYQNTTATPVQVTISTNSVMRTMIRSAVSGPSVTTLDTSTGQPAAAAPAVGFNGRMIRRTTNMGNVHLAVPERDSLVALSDGGGSFPDAYFFLPSSGSVKAEIEVQSMRSARVSYNVTARAHSTVSIVWGLSQRNGPGTPSAAELKERLKTFQDRKWLEGLPESVVKTIVNFRRDEPAGSAMALLMQPVVNLAWQNHVERGKSDILVQDEQSRMQGSVTCGALSVETAWGKTSVPLASVALLCGGDGGDRPMRVYLRNGEVLSGRVEAKDLALKAQDGVEAKLPPEKINLIFFHTAADDGKAPPEAVVLLQTHDGQRLLIGGDVRLHAISPWGGLDVGLGEIVSLVSHREPQPLFGLALSDGSNLSVLLQDDATALQSVRFGPLKLAALDLRQLWSLKAMPSGKEAGPRPAGASGSAGTSGPLCRLIGDNVLAATIDAPQLKLDTAGGTIGVPVKDIHLAERSGDPKAGGPLNVELDNGQKVAGALADRSIPVRFHGKVWEIPVQHLIGITGRPKPVAAIDKPAKAAENYVYDGGSFAYHAHEGKVEWVETAADGHIKARFAETVRDKDWIRLFDAGRKLLLRLPVGGGTSFFSTDDGKTWHGLHHVDKASQPSPTERTTPERRAGTKPASPPRTSQPSVPSTPGGDDDEDPFGDDPVMGPADQQAAPLRPAATAPAAALPAAPAAVPAR